MEIRRRLCGGMLLGLGSWGFRFRVVRRQLEEDVFQTHRRGSHFEQPPAAFDNRLGQLRPQVLLEVGLHLNLVPPVRRTRFARVPDSVDR